MNLVGVIAKKDEGWGPCVALGHVINFKIFAPVNRESMRLKGVFQKFNESGRGHSFCVLTF